MILLWLAAALAADCPAPGPLLTSAENDAMNYYLADAKAGLVKAVDAWACGPRAAPADVGRYLQVRGLLAYLDGDEALAQRAFAGAKAAGATFVADYGPQALALWEAAEAPTGAPTALDLKGLAAGEWLAIDGIDAEPSVAPGLHLLQVGRGDVARVARMVDAAGPTLVVALPEGEPAPVEPAPVEIEPVETEPVETEPVETEPVETEPVETEPVAGAWRGPFTRQRGAAYVDAAGAELRWRPTLVELAAQDPDGLRALRRRRSNGWAQGVAIVAVPAAGYGAYLFAWDATVGYNLDAGLAWGATAGCVSLGVTAAIWEAVLATRRPKRRAEIEAAAARVSRG